ncbi:hypothetical protein GVN24_29945 [Rhizobium sp. CRIBSB]|nr:hypothetical protein [Rhizobium sp. CRIBSB]
MMPSVTLPGSGLKTSRIGLGCGRLNGGIDTRGSVALIEVAMEAGIRHFDVAPSYGLGLAETVLGQALQGQADVTIATKVGIEPARHGFAKSLARAVLKPVASRIPALKARLIAAAAAPATTTHGHFTPEAMQASLDRSLLALRRDRIDLYLLHEPPPTLTKEVEATLTGFRDRGLIAAFGSGTGGLEDTLPAAGQAAQFRWRPSDGPAAAGRMAIRHGMLRWGLPLLHKAMSEGALADPAIRAGLSGDLRFDLDDPAAAPPLLLTLVLSQFPDDMILVSSNDPKRIRTLTTGVDWSAAGGQDARFNAGRDRLLAAMVAADV